jgi:CheY-like chemotaxis protein
LLGTLQNSGGNALRPAGSTQSAVGEIAADPGVFISSSDTKPAFEILTSGRFFSLKDFLYSSVLLDGMHCAKKQRTVRLFKMAQVIKILIVVNSRNDSDAAVRELYRSGFDPHWLRVDTEADYLASLNPDLDLILAYCDMQLQQFNSLRALELLKQGGLGIPFIIVSDIIALEAVKKMMQKGATGFVLKEFIFKLGPVVQNALKEIEKHTE